MPSHYSIRLYCSQLVVFIQLDTNQTNIISLYRVAPEINGIVDSVDFSGLCSNQQLFFFTLLDRASISHYNNTKIIKFG